MRISSPYARRRARLEIIPLIDIMFFLLATFVMVSLSMIRNQSIPLNLPSAGSASPRPGLPAATLAVTADGTIYWDKEPITAVDLSSKLAALLAVNPDPEISIHGDRGANFGSVIQLLDKVRQAGVRKVALQTQSDDE